MKLLNWMQWVSLFTTLLVVTVVPFLVVRIEGAHQDTNRTLRHLLCFFETRTLQNPMLTATEKRQIIRFYNEAVTQLDEPSCTSTQRREMNPLPNSVAKHPNALVSLVSSVGLGSAVVAVAQHWLGWKLSTQDGLYVAGGLSTIALFVGHNGLIGTWNAVKGVVLHGTGGKTKP